MPTGSMKCAILQLREVLLRDVQNLTDTQLLDSFVAEWNEMAFEMIVRRHGPMVLSLCRRILGNVDDAEDAFQAVFLVLARKAPSICRKELLANWLYGVAHRTSLAAKGKMARRRSLEIQVKDMPQSAKSAPTPCDEWLPLLDAELSKLPDKYRIPIVLCDLEGRTRQEAARQLKIPEGTLSSRLATARKRLADRLRRRGIVFSGGALATSLAQNAASAGVSSTMLAATVHAATSFAAGQALTTGVVSEQVAALAEGMLKAMLLTKLKIGGVLASILTFAAVIGVAMYTHAAQDEPPPIVAKAKNNVERETKTERVDRHGDLLPPDAFIRLGTSRFHGDHGHLSIAVSRDERLLVAAGYDPTIRLLDASSGRLLRELRGHKSAVWAVALSPDGKVLVSGGNDKTVKLWDIDSGKELFSFELNHPATSVAFSPDGTRIAASAKDGIVRLWNASSGRQEREITAHPKSDSGTVAIAFSPDRKLLATGSTDKVIRLWESATGKEVGRFEGHKSLIAALAFSPDGKTLLSGSSHQSGFLDIRSSAEPIEFPDKNGSLRIWDVATRKALHTLRGPADGCHSIAVAPDGKSAVAIGMQNTLHTFDIASGREHWQRSGAHLAWVKSACFVADGQKLVTCGGDGAIRSWNADTGKETRTYPGHSGSVSSLAFSPDGKTVATGGWDHRIQLWNAVSGKEQIALDGHSGAVESVDFCPDGKLLASASEDGTVAVWDLTTGLLRWRLATHGTSAKAARFSVDGKTIVSGGGDKKLRVWDVAAGKPLFAHVLTAQTQISAMAVSPGATRLALVNAEGMPADTAVVRIFETGAGKEVRKFTAKNQQSSLAFSSDGETLAISGYNGTISVWKVLSDAPPRVLKHEASVLALTFSADGRMLASAGEDNSVRLWELATGRERHRFIGSPKCFSLVFAPDSRRIASGHFNTTTLLWDTPVSRRAPRGQPDLSPERLEKVWRDLRSDDAAKAYQAIGELASAPKQAVPFIRKHVWTKSAQDVQKIERLVKELGSDQFLIRDQARRQLEEFGAVADAQLRDALKTEPGLDIRRRLELLVARLDAATPTEESLRTVRAIETLEHSASSESVEVLEMLVKSAPELRLAAQAQKALARLKRQSVD